MPIILFAITRGITISLALDEATSSKQFGYYARIFVNIDLLDLLPNYLLVKRDGYAFTLNVKYE
jgi:hypothetical protein